MESNKFTVDMIPSENPSARGQEVFNDLFHVNVNDHTETKKSGATELTYLSWPYAWAEVKKRYPSAYYSVWKNDKGLPYVYDENTGYMVYTSVTIEGITHEMWLPVMDGANKAMKSAPYTYKTKYGDKSVEQASMFDINKTIMRCLVKNLGMFGLGLYIYAGEDLPGDDSKKEPDDTRKTLISDTRTMIKAMNQDEVKLFSNRRLEDMTDEELEALGEEIEAAAELLED